MGKNCSCYVHFSPSKGEYIIYCPMHLMAEEMLVELQAIVALELENYENTILDIGKIQETIDKAKNK